MWSREEEGEAEAAVDGAGDMVEFVEGFEGFSRRSGEGQGFTLAQSKKRDAPSP